MGGSTILTELVSYVVEPPGGITQTLQLERVFHYQQIQNRWQFVPPAEEEVFWGKWLSENGRYLELVFPQRDAEIGSRLAPMLDSLMVELCGEPSIACPKDLHLLMKLGRDPRNLLRLGDGVYETQFGSGDGNFLLFLPAPSLIGKPIDEPGFQALYRGYAGWMASFLIINFNRENAFVDSQFLAERLARWNLKPAPWPDPIFPRTIHIELPAEVDPPEQDVLMLCADGQNLGLWRYVPNSNKWIDELSKIENSKPDNFDPKPWPSVEAMLARMANHRGTLISLRQNIRSQSHYRTYLWQSGELRLLLDEVEPYYIIPAMWHSEFTQYGHRGIVFRPISSSWSDGLAPWWFDYQNCLVGKCELQNSGGYPIWSPGGTRSLILQMDDSEEPGLFLGDNQVEGSKIPWLLLGDSFGDVIAEVSYGHPVGWLDEDHFVYLRPDPEAGDASLNLGKAKELVIAAVSGENNEPEIVQKIVNTAQLIQAVAEEIKVDDLEIMSTLPAPQGFDGWFILVSTSVDGEQPAWYLFWYHPQQDSVDIVKKLEGNLVLPMTMGPQGRYLAFATSAEYGIRFQIFDVTKQEFKLFDDYYPYDWSDDGEWLLFVEGDKLRIVSLENGFEWLISHDLRSCYSAVFAD